MNILIVGASSFIGKNLLLNIPNEWNVYATYNLSEDFAEFAKQKKNITAVKLDVTDEKSIMEAAKKLPEIDTAVYLAANSDPRHSVNIPALDLKLNTLGALMLIENLEIKRFIYISSSAVFLDTKLPYVFSKRATADYLKFYHEHRGLKYVVVRLYETFGPHSAKRKIFRKLVEQFDEGNPHVKLYGDGTNFLDHL